MLKQLTRGRLTAFIYADRSAMGAAAVEAGVAALRRALAERETINVMFAAAPSQEEVLQGLLRADVDWTRVNACHMDDYVGLPADAPQRFSNFLRTRLFDRLPFRSVNCMRPVLTLEEAEEEAVRYDAFLRSSPLDVCFMGAGENGHIAFNDPPVADFHDERWVKVVALDTTCRKQQVHDGCFERLDQVPTHAMTVTIPALFSAQEIICTIPAATKAAAVRDILTAPVSTACPATILATHPAAVLFLDADAASLVL